MSTLYNSTQQNQLLQKFPEGTYQHIFHPDEHSIDNN